MDLTGLTPSFPNCRSSDLDWLFFFRLLVPGLIGGVTGAYVLSSLHGELVKPFVLAYLAAIGVWLLVRGLVYPPKIRKPTFIAPLGLVGGFLDAAGGGGWGPGIGRGSCRERVGLYV